MSRNSIPLSIPRTSARLSRSIAGPIPLFSEGFAPGDPGGTKPGVLFDFNAGAKIKPLSIIIVIFFAALFSSGCETEFDPLQENNRYPYSMYGFLDLHADTQWVRVMSVLDSLVTQSPDPIHAQVTLTRETTGETTVLNDSLFYYGNFAYAWNFRTTEPLHPEEKYVVRVEKNGGQSSYARVTLPRPLPVPSVEYTEGEETGVVYGSGVENLVVAETIYTVQVIEKVGEKEIITPPFDVVFSHLQNSRVDANGDYYFEIDTWPLLISKLGVPRRQIIIRGRKILVASASEDWPDLSGLTEAQFTLPDAITNVENGTGLIAGIASRLLPLKSCFDEEDNLIPCKPFR